MSDGGKKLSFGVLIDSHTVKKWQADSIKALVNVEGVELKCFILNRGENHYHPSIHSIGYRYLERQVRNKGPLNPIKLLSVYPDTKILNIIPIRKKIANYFSDTDIEIINSLKLDFMLRFGFGILRGKILEVPELGIWSFHHADVYQFRGGPTAFWDIYYKHPLNGAILQRLTTQLDKGILLKEGYLKTVNHSFRENLYRILELSIDWPALVAKKYILNNLLSDSEEPIKTTAPIYKTPSNWQVFRFLFKLRKNKLIFHWNQLMRAEFWNIGLVEIPIENFIEKSKFKIHWSPVGKNAEYRADPFPSIESSETIYFENFSYINYKGSICSLEYENGKWQNEKTRIVRDAHLSYPFSVQHEGKYYIVPENFENNAVILYEVKNLKIVAEHQILVGKWLDPTLLYHHNTFWLFCNSQESTNESLYLFYAPQIEGPYTSHPLNPIRTDVRSSRPAGTPFYRDGAWYRPAQNCAKVYGGSISLMKIEEMSPQNYSEKWIKEIKPNPSDTFNKGIHTISRFGNFTLVDGKTYRFSAANFRSVLNHKISRILNR